MAGKIDLKIVDSDRLIEATEGKKLAEIIKEVGNEGFKQIEEKTLLDISGDENLLLATGGSAVYSESAMNHLKSAGKVVYLYVSFETMIKRIGDYSKRGIIIRPNQTIRDLYNERTALYERYADVTINCDGEDYPKYRRELFELIKGAL
jgi:shikimate kinase